MEKPKYQLGDEVAVAIIGIVEEIKVIKNITLGTEKIQYVIRTEDSTAYATEKEMTLLQEPQEGEVDA